jgi:hypothetical protein
MPGAKLAPNMGSLQRKLRSAKSGRGAVSRDANARILFPLLLLALLLPACQSRQEVRVRVDLAQAVQAVALAPAPALDGQLPTQSLVVPPEVAALPSIEPPPPTETLRRRRELALFSIEQQRVAVRQQLLQRRLQNLPELEARWRAELRAEYDTDALRVERDAAWQAAFQEYGRARFPLLVALIFAAPESDTHRQIQAQLEQHDRAWQQREQALESEYQARLARIEQEITVRVNARRREFIRNTESETQEQLAAQPDPAELYLPPPQTLPPAPTRKASLPSLRINLPARPLDDHLRARTAAIERLRRELVSQLAQEWAQVHGYRLTDDPNAPDRTDEFIRYLLAR